MGARISSNNEAVYRERVALLEEENKKLRHDRYLHHEAIRAGMLRRLREDSNKDHPRLRMQYPLSERNMNYPKESCQPEPKLSSSSGDFTKSSVLNQLTTSEDSLLSLQLPYDVQADALQAAVNVVLENNPNAVASCRFKLEESKASLPKPKPIHQRSRIGLRASNPYLNLTKSEQKFGKGFAVKQWVDSSNPVAKPYTDLMNQPEMLARIKRIRNILVSDTEVTSDESDVNGNDNELLRKAIERTVRFKLPDRDLSLISSQSTETTKSTLYKRAKSLRRSKLGFRVFNKKVQLNPKFGTSRSLPSTKDTNKVIVKDSYTLEGTRQSNTDNSGSGPFDIMVDVENDLSCPENLKTEFELSDSSSSEFQTIELLPSSSTIFDLRVSKTIPLCPKPNDEATTVRSPVSEPKFMVRSLSPVTKDHLTTIQTSEVTKPPEFEVLTTAQSTFAETSSCGSKQQLAVASTFESDHSDEAYQRQTLLPIHSKPLLNFNTAGIPRENVNFSESDLPYWTSSTETFRSFNDSDPPLEETIIQIEASVPPIFETIPNLEESVPPNFETLQQFEREDIVTMHKSKVTEPTEDINQNTEALNLDIITVSLLPATEPIHKDSPPNLKMPDLFVTNRKTSKRRIKPSLAIFDIMENFRKDLETMHSKPASYEQKYRFPELTKSPKDSPRSGGSKKRKRRPLSKKKSKPQNCSRVTPTKSKRPRSLGITQKVSSNMEASRKQKSADSKLSKSNRKLLLNDSLDSDTTEQDYDVPCPCGDFRDINKFSSYDRMNGNMSVQVDALHKMVFKVTKFKESRKSKAKNQREMSARLAEPKTREDKIPHFLSFDRY